MGNKDLSPPVIIAIIAAVVILIGIIGWKFMGTRRGPNGDDLSKPAVLPANLRQHYPGQTGAK